MDSGRHREEEDPNAGLKLETNAIVRTKRVEANRYIDSTIPLSGIYACITPKIGKVSLVAIHALRPP